MTNSIYTSITRQVGLMREMNVVANNIANASTTGFRQEGITFSEYIKDLGEEPSLSMSTANARFADFSQGTLTQTNGTFDFALQGDGFFYIQTPNGERLTRAGSFTPNEQGDLVTNDGYPVLDSGGAPVFVPPSAENISVSGDGTLSADGQPIGQIGIVRPTDPVSLVREGGTMFKTDGDVEPAEGTSIAQGFLEASNVDPILQVSRMIEVQRAYELGQKFLEREDDRVRAAMKAMMK